MIGRLRQLVDVVAFGLLRLIDRGYGAGAPVVDTFLVALAVGWSWLLLERPEVFTRGAFAGEFLLPDQYWAAPLLATAFVGAVAVLRPSVVRLRIASLLASGWCWTVVSISLGRVQPSTGTVAYFLIALLAFGGAVNVYSLDQAERARRAAEAARQAARPPNAAGA